MDLHEIFQGTSRSPAVLHFHLTVGKCQHAFWHALVTGKLRNQTPMAFNGLFVGPVRILGIAQPIQNRWGVAALWIALKKTSVGRGCSRKLRTPQHGHGSLVVALFSRCRSEI